MRKIPTLIIVVLAPVALLAQALEGVVVNAAHQPISGVNVLSHSNNQHTHSNEQGQFTIQAIEPGDTLKFSHVGYERLSLVVESLDELVTVTLQDQMITLDEVVVGRGLDALNIITDVDMQTRLVNSSQEVLRLVPGLFLGQHAGGGKAEQIFMRGFDIDHGTDIQITVDDLPVNMVSHAHGQGYADLHFLIPETIEAVDFGKGPYYADKGNFTTAGYVQFRTREKLDGSTVKMEVGQFNNYRLLSMVDLVNTERNRGYLATEYQVTDGPFDSPQNFSRLNLLGKYTSDVNRSNQIGLTLSHFTSRWDASGQIPTRAVARGTIGRFGAIDDTEGGNTGRTNLMLTHRKVIDGRSFIRNVAFVSQYDFELYSNFTFFLEDPIRGDQIRQQENRTLYGLNSTYFQEMNWGGISGEWRAGVQLRRDQSPNSELSHTANRHLVLDSIQFGGVNESNLGAFMDANLDFGKWRLSPGLRVDHFSFQYNDFLATNYETLATSKAILSPKLNIFYNASTRAQFYLKTGKGFHSNDTRVINGHTGSEILPAAYGLDLGVLWKPTSQWLVNLAYWYLRSEQEFVYVGDAGIVEPGGRSQRNGFDLGWRYQPFRWLYWNFDINYAHARAVEATAEEDFIPLAPELTLVSGLRFRFMSSLAGGVHLRYIADRPANEDNSVVADGYAVVDLNLGYTYRRVGFGVQVQNVLDTEWNETQFATTSRLAEEADATEEIHFTPGTPFFLKAHVSVRF